MGTVMSLRDDMLGGYVVPVGSIRRESTSLTYAPIEYPAIADHGLLETINQTLLAHGQTVDNGLNATLDGFYSQMHASRFGKEKNVDYDATFTELKQLGVSGIDMESSCMLVLGRLMNVKTASLTLVTVLENLKDTLSGDHRKAKEKELCEMALEAIVRYDQKGA
jgi:uridine phosphorylase